MRNKKRHLLKRLSLRSRLVLAAVVWLTAMIIAAGVTVPKQVFNYMLDSTNEQLSLYLDELSASIEVDESGKLTLATPLSDPRFNRPYSGLYWSINNDADELRSRSLWDKKIHYEDKRNEVLGARDEILITIETSLYFPEYDGPIDILIGIDEQPLEDTVAKLMGQLWIILALLYFGVLMIIVIQIQWSLSPLTKMHKELSQVRSGDKECLDGEYPREVAPIVLDLNALLFHYQELLERARHHAGNLSHALKTPLSVLRNEINTSEQNIRDRLQDPVNQIQHQIDYHLGRARMAGSKNILSVKTRPSERIDAISLAFDKVYAHRDVALINEIDSEFVVAVEDTDFDEMVGNLLENAYKWSSSIIRVHSAMHPNEEIDIIIEDDGCGIPEEKLEQVIKRGVRLDETTPGTGLGLNIVSEMAHSYRGKFTLEKSSMGGLKAVLRLKLSS